MPRSMLISRHGKKGRPAMGWKSRQALAAIGLALLAASAAQVEAKSLRLNITADPSQMEPITESELIAGDVLRNMYENLAGIDKDGKVIPVLATEWQTTDGGKTWRFKLRKGVKFHSGRELKASDVKRSFEALLTPALKPGASQVYLKDVAGAKDMLDGKATELAGVKVVDDATVDVTFAQPDVLFAIYPVRIFDTDVLAHGADWFLRESAGTGPFQFADWKRGSEVRLKAFAGYWGGAPKIDEVVFLIVPNIETSLSLYETKGLDLVEVPRSAMRAVLRDPRYAGQMLQVPAAQINYLGMNQTRYAPFKDTRVREAISLAIDREGIVKGLMGGAGLPLYGSITPGIAGYAPVAKIPYDPERARQLLAQAGFPGGKGLPPIDIQATPVEKDDLAYFADQFKKVLGMEVNVKVVERATHIKQMNAGEVAFFPWGWTADYPDALYFLSQLWDSRSPYNRVRWKNDAYDKLIDRAKNEPDAAARYKIYAEAEKIVLADFGMAPLYVRTQLTLKQPNVRNVYLTPFRYLPFAKVEVE
jgi:ABC-type transport system substrate-binding protein